MELPLKLCFQEVLMPTTSYPSDRTSQQWAILSPLVPPAKFGGRPRTANMRQVVNAIWYILRSGCQWRMLPREYPRLYDRLDVLPRLARSSATGSGCIRHCGSAAERAWGESQLRVPPF